MREIDAVGVEEETIEKTKDERNEPASGDEMLYPAGLSQCVYCTRWKGKGSCDAFPEEKSVPMKILTNEHDHRLEYPGDRGLRFDPSSEQGDQWQKKGVELEKAAKMKGLGKQ